MWKKQVGRRVCQLRRERNLTRAEFGKMIGRSAQYIGQIERGTLAISGDAVNRMCDTMGISADFIIRGTADPLATVASLKGLSCEQIQVTLDIASDVIKFLSTTGGNNALLQEALRRSRKQAVPLEV